MRHRFYRIATPGSERVLLEPRRKSKKVLIGFFKCYSYPCTTVCNLHVMYEFRSRFVVYFLVQELYEASIGSGKIKMVEMDEGVK